MREGYSILYGGFMTDRKTGKEDLLFETMCSEILCRERAKENALNFNKHTGRDYDLDTLRVGYRKVETAISPWRNTETEAELDSAIVRRRDHWYIETWDDEDLASALEDESVPINAGNIQRLKDACNGIFDDKSSRNEMLRMKVNEIF